MNSDVVVKMYDKVKDDTKLLYIGVDYTLDPNGEVQLIHPEAFVDNNLEDRYNLKIKYLTKPFKPLNPFIITTLILSFIAVLMLAGCDKLKCSPEVRFDANNKPYYFGGKCKTEF